MTHVERCMCAECVHIRCAVAHCIAVLEEQSHDDVPAIWIGPSNYQPRPSSDDAIGARIIWACFIIAAICMYMLMDWAR